MFLSNILDKTCISKRIFLTLSEKREVEALLKLNKVLPMRKMMIITKDEEKEICMDGITIEVIPVWKWLLLDEKMLNENE